MARYWKLEDKLQQHAVEIRQKITDFYLRGLKNLAEDEVSLEQERKLVKQQQHDDPLALLRWIGINPSPRWGL